MKHTPTTKNFVELNIALLILSTSGPLGRYISLDPLLTIWWRSIIAVVVIGAFCFWRGKSLKLHSNQDLKFFIVTGSLLTVSWTAYFYSLQYANVAVAMLSLFTYPVFTVLLEPLFVKTTINRRHILLSTLVTFGIYLLIPVFDIKDQITQGVLLGLISAVTLAVRNILVKTHIVHYSGSISMFYQLLILVILLLPALWLIPSFGNLQNQWVSILILGILTTAIGHSLFVGTFKYFSITTVSILSCVQPLYGILIGMIVLNEKPALQVWIGGFIIISTVLIESLSTAKR